MQSNGHVLCLELCCSCCADVTPSAVHVGNIVQGVRMAGAQGRDLGAVDDESDAARKVRI